MDKITVIHTDGNKEDFKPRLISQTIITETGTDKELAERVLLGCSAYQVSGYSQ